MEIVKPGTFDELEASARRIANPTHFILERLTGGAWAELAEIAALPVRPHRPSLLNERHFPNGNPTLPAGE